MIKKKYKKITNKELLDSINRSFSKVEEKIDTIDKKVEGLKDQVQGVDKRIDDFAEAKATKIEYKEIQTRIGFIEKKLEIKK